MSNKPANQVQEEIKLLLRATRSETRFRFIIVQYNHYDLIRRVQRELIETYPNRSILSIDLKENLTEDLPKRITTCKDEFLLLENFDELFLEENASIAVGFNQRRDSYSKLPLKIIAFLPDGNAALQQFVRKLPDVFSITSPVIQLKEEIVTQITTSNDFTTFLDSPFNNIGEAKAEIERITKRLKVLEDNQENQRLIFILKNELGKAYYFITEYQKAKDTFESILIENNLLDDDKVMIKINLAAVYEKLDNYNKALDLLEETQKNLLNILEQAHSQKEDFKENLKNWAKENNIKL